MKQFYFMLVVLVILSLACGTTTPRHLELYPTPTILPTQTARVLVIIQTQTTMPAVDSATPQISTHTPEPNCFIVSASKAVYLRPSPSDDNYPIAPIPNGSKVTDLGGRSGVWVFVALGDKQGWINQAYVEVCK